MKLKDLTLNELESMSYDEIAYLILLESGKKEKLMNLFKKICKLLQIDSEANADYITHFFEVLSTNKKFIMLDNGYWDLQINHKVNIVVEHEDEEHIDIEDHVEEETEKESDENIFYESEDTDDVVDDEFADLVVVDEDEEAS